MHRPAPFTPVYEDNHLFAVNKAAGILSQGDKTGDESLVELVKAHLKQKYNKPGNVYAGLVHRLDRPTSGILLLAKTSKAHERLARAFQERAIQKTYLAVVEARPPAESGHLFHFLKKDPVRNLTFAYEDKVKDSKPAELDYEIMRRIGSFYLLEVRPLTGRPHQIRAQLAAMGCPIKGDLKYQYAHKNSDGSICLHASSLTFTHPVKQESLTLTAPIPKTQAWQQFQ